MFKTKTNKQEEIFTQIIYNNKWEAEEDRTTKEEK